MKPRFLVITSVILFAALSRLIPHPWNFAPITGIALFGGAMFSKRWAAFFVPIAAMLLSDLIIGFHNQMAGVYLSFTLIIGIGQWLQSRRTVVNTVGATFLSSLLFFFVTNFAVWVATPFYAKTAEGLIACYVAALPFFHQTLLGDAFFVVALFGGFELAQRWVPSLRTEVVTAS